MKAETEGLSNWLDFVLVLDTSLWSSGALVRNCLVSRIIVIVPKACNAFLRLNRVAVFSHSNNRHIDTTTKEAYINTLLYQYNDMKILQYALYCCKWLSRGKGTVL